MERWRDWEVKEVIGEGSFGKVYRIERKAFGRTYEAALKVIKIPANRSEFDNAVSEGMSEEDAKAYFRDMAEAFSNEFAFMSELKGNSNIVSFEDFEVVPHEDGFSWDVFIRMELLEPFTSRLKESGVSKEEAVELGLDMCRALELCEQKNIIHRDIKPANIFISPQGTYKLGDFGIARELEKTSAGLSKKGTYSYMAPEIYRGGEYGPNADIYSLGMVLYRLLNNNRLPFLPEYPAKIKYTDTEEANRRRLAGEELPVPANADGELGRIILKACAYDPADRYKRASDMRKDLEAYRAGNDLQADSEGTVREDSPVPAAEDDDRTVAVMAASKIAPEDEKTALEGEPEAVPLVTEPVEVVSEAASKKEKPAAKEPKPAATDKPSDKDKKKAEGIDVKKPGAGKKGQAADKKNIRLIAILAGLAAAVLAIFFLVNGDYIGSGEKEYYIVSNGTFTEENIKHVKRHRSLKQLQISYCEISDEMIKEISGLDRIESIEIQNCTGFSSIDPLADMPALKELVLSGDNSAEPYQTLDSLVSRDFSNLDELYLANWSTGDGGSVLKHFGTAESLQMFDISGDIDISNIAGNSSLNRLEMERCTAANSDFSMLDSCTGLESITMNESGVTDISWMKPLSELGIVTLNGNEITSLAGLENHERLYAVKADNNEITNLSGLSGCGELHIITANDNAITDLSGLSGCGELEEVYLNNNEISDISPMASLTTLKTLDLANNEITDTAPLSSCDKMAELYLDNNSLENLNGCTSMIELKTISAGNNRISDIGGLSNTTQLETAGLQGNELTDISGLGKNQDCMKLLKLSDNKIKSIAPLKGFTMLEALSIDNNEIEDLSPLSECMQLLGLSAGRNKISDITPLESCKMLAYLDLGDNQIKDISPLAGHRADKKVLLLQNNKISDISTLAVTPEYYCLALYGNPVRDVSVIGSFENSKAVDFLYLSWNDSSDYTSMALTEMRMNIVDAPLDKQVPLRNKLDEIRSNNDGYSANITYKTKEEADNDMEAIRSKIKEAEDYNGAGNMVYKVLGG